VVLNKIKGMKILKENKKEVFLRAMGGEFWHNLVLFSVKQGYWGLENLALIPGTVGAAPVQNIGAYGSELKDALASVEAYEVKTGKKKIFSKNECKFGYRDSIFKRRLKDKYFISAVIFKLSKGRKQKELYLALQNYLDKNKLAVQNPMDICQAVIAIRKSKLPNPKILGNAGSFFKNIFVNKKQLQRLQQFFPEIPFFMEPSPTKALKGKEKKIKIPAGWLIEQCEWKGKKIGWVGVYDKQALILVNYGKATGREVLILSQKIIQSVQKKFELKLDSEVNIV
jgi:UDP-N-acetylmuramate dehydrogenase